MCFGSDSNKDFKQFEKLVYDCSMKDDKNL